MPTGGPRSTNPPRFDDASREVIAYLRQALPIGTWAISRFDGDDQVFLTVDDTYLGLDVGTRIVWSDTLCQFTTMGEGLVIVDDTRGLTEHAALVDRSGLPVGSYLGYPLTTSDGHLFGTLCGFDRGPFPVDLEVNRDLITLLGSLLSRMLDADVFATTTARELEAAQRNADSDTLTGLVNRNGWHRHLDVEESRFRRFGDPGEIIVVDLDDLKEVNDSRGHHAGDDLLRRAAETMSDIVDVPGVIARIGGDEFAILMSHASRSVVADVVRRLRAELHTRRVSASLGHARYSWFDGLDGAWRAADAAMYAEKLAKRSSTPSTAPAPIL